MPIVDGDDEWCGENCFIFKNNHGNIQVTHNPKLLSIPKCKLLKYLINYCSMVDFTIRMVWIFAN